LRILARIAERVDDDSFIREWEFATDEHGLRSSLLHDERLLTLNLLHQQPCAVLIGQTLKNITIPKGCLVALLSRDGQSFVPNGDTVLLQGDRLTIIGEQLGPAELRDRYLDKGNS
jgi:NhaP-type Na+/H+ and K+/H+ antiporter